MALPGIDPRAKLNSDAIDERAKTIASQQSIHPTAQLIGAAKEPAPRKLDPAKVRWSVWGNRSESRFKGEAFAAFVEDIRASGGNKQAALVRPITPTEDGYEYEIAYGHRRHRACWIAKQPYLAVVKELTDMELQGEMETENRSREDVSTWERAKQYTKQLSTYDSVEHMAAFMRITPKQMYIYLRIGRLPQEIIELIDDDLTITQRNALALMSLVESEDTEVQRQLKENLAELKQTGTKYNADELLKKLKTERKKVVAASTKSVNLATDSGKVYGTYSVNRAKQLKLTIDEITDVELKEIQKSLSKIIKR
jgi:ParB family chromosome partitioning protein